MTLARFGSYIQENLSTKRLIIVSSREPYVHKQTKNGIKVDVPAGGLTSAMDDVLKITGGTWVAWGSGSADRETVTDDRVLVPPGDPAYTLKRVWLTPTEVNNYYHGYSNQLLWPLCHMALDRVYYRKKFWENYIKVNRAFAKSVLEEVDSDTVVWIHDYQLCLVPKFIREKRSGLTLAHFWHIPWPNWGVFRVHPQPQKILEGLLANDLIGFQIPFFRKNFLECVVECFGPEAEIDYRHSTVTYRGHTTSLQAFPISIDYEKFNSASKARKTDTAIKSLKNKYKIVGQTGIGVDRLEYTKALLKRLQAIELFFEKYERFIGRFTFIQIAVPTRMKEPYLSYKKSVEALIEKINKKYSTGYWSPIIYIDKKIDQKDLIAYYKMADIGIISSINDGMNLVAKEYVACQSETRGMLILSELAGASEELESAIMVNPYDIEDFAQSIQRALVMADTDKALRMEQMRRQVAENDIYKWIADILGAMTQVSKLKQKRCRYLFDNIDRIEDTLGNRRLLLCLDYDGTLTPIVNTPDAAHLGAKIKTLLLSLKKVVDLAIISGRKIEDIKGRVGIEDIIYAGNHGAEIWDGEKIAISQYMSADRLLLNEFQIRLQNALCGFPAIFIEDKGATLSVHFRNLKIKELAAFLLIFEETATYFKDAFRITAGKKVFEVRPIGLWNKGDAINWIREHLGPEKYVVYVGDDTTDEDAYGVLKSSGMPISIGSNPEADYYLKEQGEIKALLELILLINTPTLQA
ncbi:MAG: bifunctional alpha,alpha-trehalose-phosphate synthase (UDP-forming)/trehalose-phosphatase [Proteobacteria bacterium]|nr:bifunctional alpha,alpha-trehalose-phosphate synthase (UDP-forming)/trehalose-phosphatase [Pseudomonadota bacterium]